MSQGAGGRLRSCGVLLAVALTAIPAYPAAQTPDFSAVLAEAREVSYHGHWRDAQALLDELAPYVDQAELRDYADFQLLQARHFVLDDRTEQGLALAESLLERNLATDQRVQALQFRANIAVLLRRYEAAFESLGEALRLQAELEDPSPQMATLNMAAYMLGRVGEYERGADYGEEALAIARRSEKPRDACVALQRLAPVYKWAERVDDSERTYREGIRECSGVGNALFVGVHQYGLADLLRREGRSAEALPLAEAAITALEDAVYTLGEYEARMIRAEILQDLGQLDASWQEELLELQTFFSDRSLWDQSARLALLQTELAEEAGRFRSALQALRDHNRARESFLGRERAMRLAYLQVEFDSRNQRQQIALLEESARAARLEAQAAGQQRRLRSFGWLLIGIVVLTLTSLLYRAFRSRRRFVQLSRHDGLSGLANHTWFFERAQAVIDQFRTDPETGRRIVLIAADIDHFKRINDRYGHRMGDSVIGRTARRLREVFPDTALVGRIGGEEFAVLVIVKSVAEAIECIETFRRPDSRSEREDDPAITMSFGLSCARRDEDIHSLRLRADEAMYRAKNAGRDRIEVDPSCYSDIDE